MLWKSFALPCMLLVLLFPRFGFAADADANDWARDNLVAHGDFADDKPGKLPEGWTVSTPNPALAPKYQVVQGEDGNGLLLVEGNGRAECFGILRYNVDLPAGKTYRFRVRFKFSGFEDVNRHLVHAVFVGNNDGVFQYHKDGPWVVGEGRFPVGGKGQVRLYFRFAPQGKVWYSNVALQECEPIKPRPAKIAVCSGGGDRKHWEKVLDAAGGKHCDVALLPETFEGGTHAMDGPAMQFLAAKAKQWKMYVSGTLHLRRGDVVYNTAPLWDRQGQLVGVYDKVMLYDPELDEGLTPGDTMPVFQADFGKVGVMTCYDSWHPEVARLLAHKGAEVRPLPQRRLLQAVDARPRGRQRRGGGRVERQPVRRVGRRGETRPMAAARIRLARPRRQSWRSRRTTRYECRSSRWIWPRGLVRTTGAAPCCRRRAGTALRATSRWSLEDDLAREAKRWCDE